MAGRLLVAAVSLFLACRAAAPQAITPTGRPGPRLSTIAGRVFDSVHAQPLAHASVVILRETAAGDEGVRTTATDDSGRYRFDSLPPGTYVATVQHPWLDSAGLGTLGARVDLVAGVRRNVPLAVPSAQSLYAATCPSPAPNGASQRRPPAAVSGVVFDGDSGRPVARAEVLLHWDEAVVDRKAKVIEFRRLEGRARTDAAGIYVACRLSSGGQVTVEARLPSGGATGLVENLALSEGMWYLPLRASSRSNAVLAGVVRTLAGTPLPNAHVRVLGTESAVVTREDGSFRITGVRPATVCLQIVALGYMPTDVIVDASSADPTISVSPLAVALDVVQVTGAIDRKVATFEQRKRTSAGAGKFIEASEIEAMQSSPMIDLIQSRTGRFQYVRQCGGTFVASHDVPLSLSSQGTPGPSYGNCTLPPLCYSQVYLDGAQFYAFHGQASPPPNLDDFSLMMVQAIEVYPDAADTPGELLGSAAACGTVVIWTK